MASANYSFNLFVSLLLVSSALFFQRVALAGRELSEKEDLHRYRSLNNFSGDGRLVAGLSELRAHVVVAKDGSGNYWTIQDAVNHAPDFCSWRYVIYIKAGEYSENVVVNRRKWNITLVGDGKDKTVVVSYRGGAILDTGALVALGDGFSAQYMLFENRAGPWAGQAVAMRSDSHRSAFYRCGFMGYQDTLLANINYQFYKECDIVGTIDFIFGEAAVVFQNCNIYPRRPIPGQANVILAQGKNDPRLRSGIVLQNCYIAAYENLGPTRTFLGRPWKSYSTAIIIETYMGGLIDPRGWKESMEVIENGETATFREYGNWGPGSDTRGRVRWMGYKAVTNPEEVKMYTVTPFIDGDQWIPAHAVPYKAGL
ncbi:hypothetical protein H6P81_019752 [Aristolochia fimbriata]|uniref:Pectinesterase n=1 Tax=Aristolochia fimbriata TaxID=158543 RepID=A0AAV7DWI5_ARIFI|nr:hypothetical protein H6P81_019752 [Aristolochia fimbriata]